jgi:ribonuclease HII
MGTSAGAGRAPSLRVERELLRGSGATLLAAIDEVGRGALAGPVTVGVVVVAVDTGTAPQGVRDSKLLAPAAREALVPRIRRWALASSVGSAGPDEIDACGIVAALRLAGERALASLELVPDLVLLDGSHDWLSRPDVQASFDGPSGAERALDVAVAEGLAPAPDVVTRIKADLTCSAVAAASVLAKTHRDALMVGLAPSHPQYGWDENKGYASPEHVAALRAFGPCGLHRTSWRLPGQDESCADALGPAHDQEVAV